MKGALLPDRGPEHEQARASRMRQAWLCLSAYLRQAHEEASSTSASGSQAHQPHSQPEQPQAGPSHRLFRLRNILEARKTRKEHASEIMKQCGVSHRDELSFEAFCKFAAVKELELYRLFQSIDQDNDGLINHQDLAAALERAGYHLSPEALNTYLRTLKSHSAEGASDKQQQSQTSHQPIITFDAFRTLLLPLPHPASVENLMEYLTVHQAISKAPPFAVNQDADVDLAVEPSRKSLVASQQQAHASSSSSSDASSDPSASSSKHKDENDVTDGGIFDNAGRYLLAGGVAGAVSRTCTAPFDRLKVYLITQTPKHAHARRKKGSLRKACAAIFAENGRPSIRNFWVGNGLSVAKIFPESAIKFGSYETAKRTFARYVDHVDSTNDISASSRFLAGGIGGLTAQTAIYPVETIKTRTMSSTKSSLRGTALIFSTARTMWLEGGMRYFYRGLTWGLCGVFPYAACDMSLYDLERRTYLRITQQETPGVFASLCFGACSGGLSASIVYPLNLLRTRLQAQGTSAHPHRYTGLADVCRRTYASEGLVGFYKGLTPTLMKVVPSMSISWALFELTCAKLFER